MRRDMRVEMCMDMCRDMRADMCIAVRGIMRAGMGTVLCRAVASKCVPLPGLGERPTSG